MQEDLQCQDVRLKSNDRISIFINSIVNYSSKWCRLFGKHNSVDGVVLLLDAWHVPIVDADADKVVEFETAR